MRPGYNITILPGAKEGISGNTIIGYNVGINQQSPASKRDNVKKAFEFIVSKEVQRKFVINKRIISSVSSLYDDEEICSIVNCEIRKKIQPIGRPIEKNYEEFTLKFNDIITDYLINNKIDSAFEALQKIEDITKIYWVKLDDSVLNLILLCVLIIIFCIMILSLIISFFEKFRPYFDFLSYDFWIIIVIGLIVMESSSLLGIGERTENKCRFTYLFFSLGSTLTLTPILHKLITNFPQENKISTWSKKHKHYFLLIFCMIDFFNIILFFIPSYYIEELYIDGGKNYKICKFHNTVVTILTFFCLGIKFLMILSILLLIYTEWNLESTYQDLRLLIIFIYNKCLVILIIIIIDNMEFENYLYLFYINQATYIFYSIIAYITFFGIRIYWGMKRKETNESKFILKVNKSFVENTNRPSNIVATSEMYTIDDAKSNSISGSGINNKNNMSENFATMNNSTMGNVNSNDNNNQINNNKKNLKKSNSNNILLTIYNLHYQKTLSQDSIRCYESQEFSSITKFN